MNKFNKKIYAQVTSFDSRLSCGGASRSRSDSMRVQRSAAAHPGAARLSASQQLQRRAAHTPGWYRLRRPVNVHTATHHVLTLRQYLSLPAVLFCKTRPCKT